MIPGILCSFTYPKESGMYSETVLSEYTALRQKYLPLANPVYDCLPGTCRRQKSGADKAFDQQMRVSRD
jgi:hypothetical protein